MNEKELYQSAVEAASNGNKEKAIEILNRIINDFPNSTEAENARAFRYNLKEGTTKGGSPSAPSSETLNASTNRVTVTDVQMPFGSMVVFMVKWAIASIPAIIILFVLFSIVAGMFGGIIGGYSRY